MTWCAGPAISACTSSRARSWRAIRSRRRRCARRKTRRRSIRGPMWSALAGGRRGPRRRRADSAFARHRKRRPGLSDRGRRGRRALRALAVAARDRRCLALLQFLFLPPIYTFTITDPTNVVAFVFFTIMAVVVSQCCRARANPSRGRARARARGRAALRVQPQARGRRHARRRAVGDGLSDRADAQGPGRFAAARERRRSP